MPSSIVRIFVVMSLFQFFCCGSTGMEVGDKLPALAFYDLGGNEVSVCDYIERDKVLLLHFWGAACCLTYSMPTMKAVSAVAVDEKLRGVTVVSVNLDYQAPRVLRVSRELNISHPMLNDRTSAYYRELPQIQFFFPLAVLYAVDGDGIIRGKLEGHQLEPAIRELIRRAQAGRD
jgi:hypothetical protein